MALCCTTMLSRSRSFDAVSQCQLLDSACILRMGTVNSRRLQSARTVVASTNKKKPTNAKRKSRSRSARACAYGQMRRGENSMIVVIDELARTVRLGRGAWLALVAPFSA